MTVLIISYLPIFGLNPNIKITQYIFDQWKSQSGLSQISVKSIIQTSDNYIWLGTSEGLLRFDGVKFTEFNNKITPEIKNNYIKKLLEDSHGNLWIGTNNGLTLYRKGKFSTFTTENGLTSNSIGSMIEDQQGQIWVATKSGLNCIVGTSIYTFTKKDGLLSDNIRAIYEDRNGSIWISTNQGLNCLIDDKIISYTTKDGLSHNNILAIMEDEQGRLWIMTSKGLDSLTQGKFTSYSIKGKYFSGSVRTFIEDSNGNLWMAVLAGLCKFKDGRFTFYTRNDGLTSHIITAICEDRDGNVWIGTPNGLNRLTNGRFTSCDSEDGLTHDLVSFIYEDREGSLWLGTPDGLNRLRDGKFISFTKNDGLNDVIPVTITEDKKGNIWVGSSAGLNRLKEGQITSFTTQEGLSSIWIKSLCSDNSGNLWISTNNGLNCYKNGKFIYYDTKTGLLDNDIGTIYNDNNGNLWIASSKGLNCYTNGTFTNIHRENGSSIRNISVFIKDKKENLWIGTHDNGLLRYRGGRFYTHDLSRGLCSNNIKSLYIARSGYLWIGTDSGLNLYKNNTFFAFREENGLFANNIHQILEDNTGDLWMSSSSGVFTAKSRDLVDFADGKIKSFNCIPYGKPDGMSNSECIGLGQPAGCKSSDGRLWFLTMDGVSVINPDKIKLNLVSPMVKIEKMIANKNTVDINKEVLNLPSDTKNLEFQYTALSFLVPERVYFKYKLIGLDDQWQEVQTRRIAYYTKLPPGHYRFQVIACNDDGIWNQSGASINFYLEPYFYQTWWFFLLCGLGTFISGFSFYRIRIRSLNARKEELERLVDERTSQLAQANQELEKLSIVARETDNAVIIMDAKGNFKWVNEGFTRMYGETIKDLKRKSKNLTKTISNSNANAVVNECINKKKAGQYESYIATLSGKKIWVQTTITPILDENGQLKNLIAIDSDITKIKDAENKAKEARQIAEKAKETAEDANRSKSEFLARMSHEIRTPMNGVIGFTDMLLNTQLTEEQVDYAKTINRSGEALIVILNDILDFSKIEAGEITFDPIDFDPEITVFDVCELILPRIGTKPIEVLCRVGDSVPAYVFADPGRFRQVVVNLMGNASKFTEKGEIELSLDVEKEEKEQLLLHLKVRDTGIGIPKDKVATIFDAFHQADGSTTRKYGGTGLGLAICKQISAHLGGDVWVQSEERKGSTFHFTVWVDRSKKALAKKVKHEYLNGRRVFIVDDNPTNLEILSHVLQHVNMKVVVIDKAEETIPVIISHFRKNKPFDIGIIDIQMPEFSGYDLAKEIRKLDSPISQVPLLAFTSSTVSRSKTFKDAGFNGFLPKPIQRKKLLKMVTHLLGLEIDKQKEIGKEEMVTQHTIAEDAKHSVHILLAEDNPINLKLARYMLGNAGYPIDIAKNGVEAVEMFTSEPDKYNLILMDVQMPEMDGKIATKIIREKGFKDIPIIAMTAEAMKGDREKCINAGMNDYIPKPLKREVVFKIIKKWCLET
jgi:PAS domain S-box-containing protein